MDEEKSSDELLRQFLDELSNKSLEEVSSIDGKKRTAEFVHKLFEQMAKEPPMFDNSSANSMTHLYADAAGKQQAWTDWHASNLGVNLNDNERIKLLCSLYFYDVITGKEFHDRLDDIIDRSGIIIAHILYMDGERIPAAEITNPKVRAMDIHGNEMTSRHAVHYIENELFRHHEDNPMFSIALDWLDNIKACDEIDRAEVMKFICFLCINDMHDTCDVLAGREQLLDYRI